MQQDATGFRDALGHFRADRMAGFTILVGALGYFVDVFDLLLFSILRKPSLTELGVSAADMLSTGVWLLNVQMAGLLIGGVIWGVMGDRLGRISVLFGSILLYSLANIANAFVHSVDAYAALRFITGLGLAGELGVGVTLASELLPRAFRGLGTTLISAIGVLGAAAAAVVADITDWRTAYIIGGVMGLLLLAARLNVKESQLFRHLEQQAGVSRGNILLFFTKAKLFWRYLAVVCIGAPLWAVIGMFITFTPEFAKDFGIAAEHMPTAGNAVLYSYAGIALGGLFSGILSQVLRSRRKSIAVSLLLLIAATLAFTESHPAGAIEYYALCIALGFACGYWAMFVQVGAEQFGTNLRATAATSLPNVARGLTIPITAGFRALNGPLGITNSGLAVMAVVIALAFIGLAMLRETFSADLDYIEVH